MQTRFWHDRLSWNESTESEGEEHGKETTEKSNSGRKEVDQQE